MKKILLIFLSIICLPVFSQPLNLTDWQRPYMDKSVSNQAYTSVLNCEKKTPYYVFYNLFPNDFIGNAVRATKWPSYVPQDIQKICGANYATTKDYLKSGYDRGHLAPAANFNSCQTKKYLTFSFANAAPQNKKLNEAEWKKIEEIERNSATTNNGITVITGVIQSQNNYIGNNVGVPDYYYKIILWKDEIQINNVAYLARNVDSVPEKVDIKYLENLSGINFGL